MIYANVFDSNGLEYGFGPGAFLQPASARGTRHVPAKYGDGVMVYMTRRESRVIDGRTKRILHQDDAVTASTPEDEAHFTTVSAFLKTCKKVYDEARTCFNAIPFDVVREGAPLYGLSTSLLVHRGSKSAGPAILEKATFNFDFVEGGNPGNFADERRYKAPHAIFLEFHQIARHKDQFTSLHIRDLTLNLRFNGADDVGWLELSVLIKAMRFFRGVKRWVIRPGSCRRFPPTWRRGWNIATLDCWPNISSIPASRTSTQYTRAIECRKGGACRGVCIRIRQTWCRGGCGC